MEKDIKLKLYIIRYEIVFCVDLVFTLYNYIVIIYI